MDGSIGFITSQSVQFYIFVNLYSKINFMTVFEQRIHFLIHFFSSTFIKKQLPLNTFVEIEFDTHFIAL